MNVKEYKGRVICYNKGRKEGRKITYIMTG